MPLPGNNRRVSAGREGTSTSLNHSTSASSASISRWISARALSAASARDGSDGKCLREPSSGIRERPAVSLHKPNLSQGDGHRECSWVKSSAGPGSERSAQANLGEREGQTVETRHLPLVVRSQPVEHCESVPRPCVAARPLPYLHLVNPGEEQKGGRCRVTPAYGRRAREQQPV